jgi:hypothetical protein
MSIRRQPSIALEQPVRDSLTKLGRSSEENADALPKQEGSLQSSGLTRSRVPALARRLLLIMLFNPSRRLLEISIPNTNGRIGFARSKRYIYSRF